MISCKHISKITTALTIFALIACIFAMCFPDKISLLTTTDGYSMEYQNKLFDTSEIIDLNISMDENDWNEMLDKATEENYYQCDVTINNTTFYKVGIRPKGNTSLSSIANDPDNNRYSFKLEFDHYIEGQTCFGLDKLVLNNNYADTTSMKEAIIYDMFRFLNTDASLYNYAKISVNSEYWGIYLALEAVEESFMFRNYGAEKGYLYKPDSMDNGKKGKNSEKSKNHGGGNGANLNYIDDDLDSYFAIWDAEVNESSKADRKRVVEALKNVKFNPEKYIDTEQILKYMAVHNFSVNDDSLSGNMAHNYYLYEANGQISIIPWDYNLAFGGMNSQNATDVINEPIDDKYSSTQLFDFVLDNEKYKNLYHEYYQKLINDYFESGKFDEVYQKIRSQIDELTKADPNAMYSYSEYTKAADTLYEAITLRAESVKGQLAGNIPSTSEEQRSNSSSLINASHIILSDMGQFMGGGDMPQMHGKREEHKSKNK